MGDMFTKIILTCVNDYACRMAGATVYSLVGDDLIVLSNLKARLERVQYELRRCGMRISDEDTFVSDSLAFYCEEGCIVPQHPHQVPRVQMRRGAELFYLDYPRIRLLIPTHSETDAYSSSNTGRFALLGKESLWVHKNNGPAAAAFARAVLIQHIVVPQDKDTLCPFIPVEIGGDGAFPHTPEFLRFVVEKRSRHQNVTEVRYRMASLLENKFSFRLVRSERFDKVVTKHHLYVPKIEGLAALLPESAIIRPTSDAGRMLINSVDIPHLERPTQTFIRLCKEVYYRYIFQGRDPPEPVFDISRNFGAPSSKVLLSYQRFRSTWMDPGFIYHDVDEYFVNKDEVVPHATLGMGWNFRGVVPASDRQMFDEWVKRNLTLRDQSMDDLVRFINTGEPLIPRVADRLSEYFESDVYVMGLIRDNPNLVIVTRDIKLGFRAFRHLEGVMSSLEDYRQPYVVCLDPILYLVGRMDEALALTSIGDDYQVIEDAGSILHCDFTEFEAGCPLTVTEEELFMGEIVHFPSRFHDYVRVLTLQRTCVR